MKCRKVKKTKKTRTSIPDHCRERPLVIAPFFTRRKKQALHTRRGSRTLQKSTRKEGRKHISHSENDGSSCRRDLRVMLDNNAEGGGENKFFNSGGCGGGCWGEGGRLGCELADHMVPPPPAAAARRVSLNERICAAVAWQNTESERGRAPTPDPHRPHPAIPPPRNVRSRVFFLSCDAPSKGTRSLNKQGRTIVAAAGDSLKLSAPTLQEIKFMKSVLKGARRSPKAKVQLDK